MARLLLVSTLANSFGKKSINNAIDIKIKEETGERIGYLKHIICDQQLDNFFDMFLCYVHIVTHRFGTYILFVRSYRLGNHKVWLRISYTQIPFETKLIFQLWLLLQHFFCQVVTAERFVRRLAFFLVLGVDLVTSSTSSVCETSSLGSMAASISTS